MIPIGDDSPSRKTPVVTYSLVAANVLIYAAAAFSGDYEGIVRKWGFTPANVSFLTVFTSMFLHGGFFHVAGNMLYLWIFGDNVEDVLGRAGYLAFYLAMGAAATLGQWAYEPASKLPMIGASGAVSGILGAYVLLFPRNRVKILLWLGFFGKLVTISAIVALSLYFGMQLLYGMLFSSYSGVAYWAHIAGFAAGLAATALLVALKAIERPVSREKAALYKAAREVGAIDGDAVLSYEPALAGPGGMAVFVEGDGSGGAGHADPRARVGMVIAALGSGDVDTAVDLARREMRLSGRNAAEPSAFVHMGDAFYNRHVFPMAYELYYAFIARAAADDARLAEVKFRAGMVASRYLHDPGKARPLLADAARMHDRDDRRALAEKELASIDSGLARTGIDTDGALVSGPCAVVRQTARAINIAEVGRAVSAVTGTAFADVTRLIRSSVGFIASDLDPMKAKDLAARLQEMGISVLVIPADKLVVLPEAQRAAWIATGAEGVAFKTDAMAPEPIRKTWEEVYYASAGRVRFETRKRSSAMSFGGSDVHVDGFGMPYSTGRDGGADPTGWMQRTETTEKLVFDVFTLNPFQCFRCTEGEVTVGSLDADARQGMRGGLVGLVTDFVAHCKSVSCNEGVALVAADAHLSRWRGLTFDGIRDFEQYNCWRLQLEQYG